MPVMSQPMRPTSAPSNHHNTVWRILVVVLIVIIVATAAWFGYVLWQKHHQPARTPEQTLNDLRNASYNDTSTDTQKSTTLNTLEKGSRPNPVTKEDQLQTLNALRQ